MNDSILFLVLRRMRAPLIVMILVYAVSVFGLVLIPGVDAEGRPTPPMSFFDAFYFISYTASTIGFGEIPNAFSYAQRFWVTACIYLTVIGWSYAILSLLSLLKDEGLQRALATNRFSRQVRRMSEPFCIICGAGETGSIICRTLDQVQMRFVVIDDRPAPLHELELGDYHADVPSLLAEAQQPSILQLAGLQLPNCKAVLAVTNSDEVNLAIAMNVRLLNPGIPIIARAEKAATGANMASFGTNFIVDPYALYAKRLALALRNPPGFQLIERLTRVPGTPLPDLPAPPTGHWIVCGYGHFGRTIVRELDALGMHDHVTIIDPRPTTPDDHQAILSTGTESSPLIDAGIANAVGLVAGSDNDINNLSIAITARQLNAKLFIVMRQNSASNSALFERFDADLTMVTTRTIAHACLSYLTTPMLGRFIREIEQRPADWSAGVLERLKPVCKDKVPIVWRLQINRAKSPALTDALVTAKLPLTLSVLLTSNRHRDEQLPIVPLLVERSGHLITMPPPDFMLVNGDRILFTGTREAWDEQKNTAQNANTLQYVISGKTSTGSLLGKLLGK